MKQNIEDYPGTNKSTFKVILKVEFKDDSIDNKLEVISKPICYYNKWYHKILNILTLGYLFNSYWSYKIKIVDKE